MYEKHNRFNIYLAKAASIVFYIFLFPLICLNKWDYNRHIKKKQYFYESIIIQLVDNYPFLYEINAFLWHFPVGIRTFDTIPPLSGSVLQVGCGTGLFNKYCKKYKKNTQIKEWVNLDLNMKSLQYGLKKKRFQSFLQASIYNVPMEDAHFDKIVFSRCFHHIHKPKRAIYECERLLNHHGEIIIYDPVKLDDTSEQAVFSNTYFDGTICVYNKHSLVRSIEKYLPDNLVISSVNYKRNPSVLNYNRQYRHTDAVVVIKKIS